MSQPKVPPLSVRLGCERLAMIDVYAKAHALSRHLAVLVLIDASLRVEREPTAKAVVVPKPAAARSSAEPVRERFTMDDVRPKFVPRLKGGDTKR